MKKAVLRAKLLKETETKPIEKKKSKKGDE